MAQKQPGQDGPSLELPSLGFGRKRKRERSEPHEQPAAAEEQGPAATDHHAPEESGTRAPDPTAAPTADVAETRALAPPAATPRAPVPDPEPAPPLFVDEVPTDTQQITDDTDETTAASGAARRKRDFRLPAIGGIPAAMLTGTVVGALLVGLTWGALHLCELLQGTSSCGNPGFFLLLAIAVSMVVLGKVLLAAFDVPEPGSTSFLGVGLVVVIALLFLVDLLFHWWMILVIPAVALAAYALSHWVTTAFVDVPDDDLHR